MGKYELRFSGKIYQQLQSHLFPGDGLEAIALVLCGRHESKDRSILLAHRLHIIPHHESIRGREYVNWNTDNLVPLILEAADKDMAILKIHSHPGGNEYFSGLDDKSDTAFFSSLYGWFESDYVHGSVVMLPSGKLFGRVFTQDMASVPIDKIIVAGDQISVWDQNDDIADEYFSERTIQTFGNGTYSKLRYMKVGVVGCSGTGSPTIEQLYRLGVGKLVLVDPDKIEYKNLNRILHSKRKDADQGLFKVDVIQNSIKEANLGTQVKVFRKNLYDYREALAELITCDIIFGCMDSVDGRHLLNQLTNFYLIPYFDLGVRLDADGEGGINKISATVHYIQPGCSSLLSRGQYTIDQLAASCLYRQDPEEYGKRRKEGYIHNVKVENPAVISINMQISSMAVNEFLNRIHNYKYDPPHEYTQVSMDFSDGSICNVSEESLRQDDYQVQWAGRGDCTPFLRMPELG